MQSSSAALPVDKQAKAEPKNIDQFDGMLAFGIDQLARASGLSRSFIYQAIAASELRTIKVGKRRLVLRDDALAWLRGHAAEKAT